MLKSPWTTLFPGFYFLTHNSTHFPRGHTSTRDARQKPRITFIREASPSNCWKQMKRSRDPWIVCGIFFFFTMRIFKEAKKFFHRYRWLTFTSNTLAKSTLNRMFTSDLCCLSMNYQESNTYLRATSHLQDQSYLLYRHACLGTFLSIFVLYDGSLG